MKGTPEISLFSTAILQMKKLRLSEVKCLAHSYMVSEGHSQGWNPGLLTFVLRYPLTTFSSSYLSCSEERLFSKGLTESQAVDSLRVLNPSCS